MSLKRDCHFLKILDPDPTKLATLRPDLTISSCEIMLKSEPCTKDGCGHASFLISAVSDFVLDGTRTSRIATAGITRTNAIGWKGFNPPDVKVCTKYLYSIDLCLVSYSVVLHHQINFRRMEKVRLSNSSQSRCAVLYYLGIVTLLSEHFCAY